MPSCCRGLWPPVFLHRSPCQKACSGHMECRTVPLTLRVIQVPGERWPLGEGNTVETKPRTHHQSKATFFTQSGKWATPSPQAWGPATWRPTRPRPGQSGSCFSSFLRRRTRGTCDQLGTWLLRPSHCPAHRRPKTNQVSPSLCQATKRAELSCPAPPANCHL